MAATLPGPLVSTDWLAEHLNDASVRILDCSYHLPSVGRNAREEYADGHIPGAGFFDIDAIADPDTDLPHMLPDAERFAAAAGQLGIANAHTVIVYDCYGVFSAPRVWWTFKTFGHENVAVLDGGLKKWLAEDRPMTARAESPMPAVYQACKNEACVRDLDAVRRNIETGTELFVDARSAGRFHGTEPEPRPGMRSGHVPGSVNLPFDRLLDPASGCLRVPDEIRAAFDAAGVDGATPVITSCGSGVTACVLTLGLDLIGRPLGAVYDGSWTEWGGRDDTAAETE